MLLRRERRLRDDREGAPSSHGRQNARVLCSLVAFRRRNTDVGQLQTLKPPELAEPRRQSCSPRPRSVAENKQHPEQRSNRQNSRLAQPTHEVFLTLHRRVLGRSETRHAGDDLLEGGIAEEGDRVATGGEIGAFGVGEDYAVDGGLEDLCGDGGWWVNWGVCAREIAAGRASAMSLRRSSTVAADLPH